MVKTIDILYTKIIVRIFFYEITEKILHVNLYHKYLKYTFGFFRK